MSGEDAPADAGPPSAVPTTPVSAASNGGGSAKKRLLPMELRRRRRAAKLQITEERNVATISASDIIAGISDSHTPDDAAPTDPAPTDTTNAQASSPLQEESASAAAPVPGTSIEPTEQATEQVQQPDETPLSSRESATPVHPNATKRLQNLFSFSILDRKRQKLQHRESLVEVPTNMKLNHVPLDVALKSKVVISMSFSFPFIRPRAASITAAAANQASDVPEVRWLQALRYYAHPASSLPTSLNATNDRQLEESEFYVNRFRVWQESFRHAYFAFRRLARDGTLYVRYPEFVACFFIDDGKAEAGTREPSILDLCASFTVQRVPEDEEKPNHGQKRLRAVISQSNARLRKELHRRGVEFNVPFNLRALQKPVTGLELNDSDLTGHSIPASGTDQSVHGPDSLLHFSGHHAVHGLYEFLLNRKPHSNQDVPEIIAPHPFTNASIRSIGVRFMGKTSGRGVGEDTTSSGQATAIRSEVELSGFCLPFVIENLIRCLEDSQKEEGLSEMAIKAALETAPMCERLNAILLDDNKMSAMSASRVGREREEWKQQLDFAKRRLQSVRHTGSSSIEIEMATR